MATVKDLAVQVIGKVREVGVNEILGPTRQSAKQQDRLPGSGSSTEPPN